MQVDTEVNMKKESRNGLRMKEVTEATGLPKSTILHYVAQGLLPEPMRTGRNMAYYDSSCIERARFVKTMQEKYSFSLERIKKLLQSKDDGKDTTHLVELDAVIFGTDETPGIDRQEYLNATGLTSEQLSELLAANLIIPLKPESFKQDDVEAGKAYSAAFAFGVSIDDFSFYATAAKDLVDCMMLLRQRLTGSLPDEQDARTTAKFTKGARLLRNYVMDHTFQRRVASAKTLKDKELLS
jgi:DNA-binding transcriptional MerR regulator